MSCLKVVFMILIYYVQTSKIFINNSMTSFDGKYISWNPTNMDIYPNCNATINDHNGVKLQCNYNSYTEGIVLMKPINTYGYHNFVIKFDINMNGSLLSGDDTCGAYYSTNNALTWYPLNVYTGEMFTTIDTTKNIEYNFDYIDDKPSILIKFEINANSNTVCCYIKNIVLIGDEINSGPITFKQFFKSKQNLYGVISTALILISCCIWIFLFVVNKQLKKIRKEIKAIKKKQQMVSIASSTPSIKPVKSTSSPWTKAPMKDDTDDNNDDIDDDNDDTDVDDDDDDMKTTKKRSSTIIEYHNRYETNSRAIPIDTGSPIMTSNDLWKLRHSTEDNNDDDSNTTNPKPIKARTLDHLAVHNKLNKAIANNTPLSSVRSPISPLSGINTGNNNVISPENNINLSNDTSSESSDTDDDTEYDSA